MIGPEQVKELVVEERRAAIITKISWRKLHSKKALEHDRRWREKNREKVKQIRDNHKARYPLKFIARHVLSLAVFDGKIIRPKVCSNCPRKCKPEGHHPDYSKPLEVIWLCRPCHLELHRKQGKIQ